MNISRLFSVAGLLVFLLKGQVAAASGPALSIRPLLQGEDCESEPGLLGDWTTFGDLNGTWTLQKSGDRTYRLSQKRQKSDPSKRLAFDICLAHLGGYLFFDATTQVLQGEDQTPTLNDDDSPLWIPLHLVGRLEVEEDAMHFLLLDDSRLNDELSSGRLLLAHTQDDEGTCLLTASSNELKEFAERHATEKDIFSCEVEFTRAPQADAAILPAQLFRPPRVRPTPHAWG